LYNVFGVEGRGASQLDNTPALGDRHRHRIVALGVSMMALILHQAVKRTAPAAQAPVIITVPAAPVR
jgi:hypothetical protein